MGLFGFGYVSLGLVGFVGFCFGLGWVTVRSRSGHVQVTVTVRSRSVQVHFTVKSRCGQVRSGHGQGVVRSGQGLCQGQVTFNTSHGEVTVRPRSRSSHGHGQVTVTVRSRSQSDHDNGQVTVSSRSRSCHGQVSLG